MNIPSVYNTYQLWLFERHGNRETKHIISEEV